ncbi:MAG: hypothetical protein LUE65_01045 [Clostridiales bacterium]|nr:hypothetical protein [Clostridiales bacterium]
MIHELLMEGRENARTGRELCKVLGIKQRDLTLAVERERKDGKPICASTSSPAMGYYLAESRAEMERYCRSLSHRRDELGKTLLACNKMLADLPAEGEMDG